MERGVYEVFSIEGGRKHFYQWDLSQKIVVKDPTINEVHFCNGTRDCSLVTVVKDGKADVPNVLLQTAGKVKVYGYSVNHTVVEYVYKVVERTKPEDYVYEETEVLRYEDLERRVSTLEKNGGGSSATPGGVGIPTGGKAGQYLRKKSDKDGDIEWADIEIPEQYGLITYDQDKAITIT